MQVGSEAAALGHLHVFKWIREQKSECLDDEYILYCAGTAGQLHILQWLQQQPSFKVRGTALVLKHTGVVPRLRSLCLQMMSMLSSGTWSFTLEDGAGNGHLHIIQWLRVQDPQCKWSIKAYMQAASSGHLHIIQWLREQDPPCPWDPPPYKAIDPFCAAADSRHLHIMSGFTRMAFTGSNSMALSTCGLQLKWVTSGYSVSILHSSCHETICAASVYLGVF